MKRKDFAYLLIIVSLIFGIMETQYFGWNLTPQSLAETICDGISLLLNFYGLYLLFTNKRKKDCVIHNTDWHGKCFKCGEQVFTRNNS